MYCELAKKLCDLDNLYIGCLGFATLAIGSLFIVEFALRRLEAAKQRMHQALVNGNSAEAKETAATVDMVHDAFVAKIAPVVFVANMVKLILGFIGFTVLGLFVDAGGRILAVYLPGNEEAVCLWAFRLHLICIFGILGVGGFTSYKLLDTLKEVLEYERKVEELIRLSKDKNQGIKNLLK